MTGNGHPRIRRFAISSVIALIATIAASYLLSPRAALATGVLGFLGVAVASDDKLGTCLPLAVFLLIGLALLLLVFVGTILVNT
jgi:hypothetical protein